MKAFFGRLRADVGRFDSEQRLLLLTAVSIFLPYVLCAVVLATATLRALLIRSLRQQMFAQPGARWVFVFALLNFFSPLYFKNLPGVACYFGALLLMCYLLYCRVVMTPRLFQCIADAAGFMSMCCAVVARLQKITPAYRSMSVFMNANYYGMIIEFMVLLCLYRLLLNNGNRFYLIAIILMNLYGLKMADCQSAWFCIAFGALLLLCLTRHFRIAAAVAAVGAVGLLLFYSKLTILMPRLWAADSNLAIRAGIWQAGWKGFLQSPLFGRGMMGYMQLWQQYGSQPNYHCHQLALDLLCSYGAVGSVPLVAFVVRRLRVFWRKNGAPLIWTLTAVVLLHGLVDVTIAWVQTGALAVVFLALPDGAMRQEASR